MTSKHTSASILTQAFTYEPEGRDPASIEKIRALHNQDSIPLTIENFDELTSGKLVFLKFFAPYCPHCNSMAKAWNELASYYHSQNEPDMEQNNENTENNVLIGSIDCTDSPKGKELCARFKIIGLPTLLYGDASFGGAYLEEYAGDKDFQSLKSFAIENLVLSCGPWDLNACSPDSREELQSYMSLSYSTLDSRIKLMESRLDEIETNFRNEFDTMQKNYDEQLTEKEMKVLRAKENIKLIKEVLAAKS